MNGFPTIEEVEAADREQLARWYRFVPSGDTAAESAIVNRREKLKFDIFIHEPPISIKISQMFPNAE